MITTDAARRSSDEANPARSVLIEMLRSQGGCVSLTALRKQLEMKGIANAKAMITQLKFLDSTSSNEPSSNARFWLFSATYRNLGYRRLT